LIPYKDDNPTTLFPFFTITLIVLNVLIYLFVAFSPSEAEKIVYAFGAMPAALMGFETTTQPLHPALTVFTSMFLHGGLFHLGGNMLYLWIFGNNIEDRLGHLRFIVFYLLGGAIAAYAHAVSDPHSVTPMIGASGAISAVLGAYLLLFPRASVYTLIFLGFFVQVVRLPALIVIGFWAIIQVVNGIVTKGLAGQGGIAWFAHVGGFVFGVAAIRLFMLGRRRRQWS
jgi:membrane associated rhomboid family serine protease